MAHVGKISRNTRLGYDHQWQTARQTQLGRRLHLSGHEQQTYYRDTEDSFDENDRDHCMISSAIGTQWNGTPSQGGGNINILGKRLPGT